MDALGVKEYAATVVAVQQWHCHSRPVDNSDKQTDKFSPFKARSDVLRKTHSARSIMYSCIKCFQLPRKDAIYWQLRRSKGGFKGGK